MKKEYIIGVRIVAILLLIVIIIGPFVPVYFLSEKSTFIEAAGRGDVDTVREWLRNGIDPNSSFGRGDTALSRAQKHGHTEVVKILRRAGAK